MLQLPQVFCQNFLGNGIDVIEQFTETALAVEKMRYDQKLPFIAVNPADNFKAGNQVLADIFHSCLLYAGTWLHKSAYCTKTYCVAMLFLSI